MGEQVSALVGETSGDTGSKSHGGDQNCTCGHEGSVLLP
ncbi:hypothetical protein C882_2945 [Caenispirillum salinarum AK4]|uniref:Uncharacterized protein n=1 Tax=Caenispirillum salinarum AK4 TaxID=1238182 RepID=K9GJD2_9PROT|nr:hypothetical protein C882_2945 [Caenispirillum salinarum AK4]